MFNITIVLYFSTIMYCIHYIYSIFYLLIYFNANTWKGLRLSIIHLKTSLVTAAQSRFFYICKCIWPFQVKPWGFLTRECLFFKTAQFYLFFMCSGLIAVTTGEKCSGADQVFSKFQTEMDSGTVSLFQRVSEKLGWDRDGGLDKAEEKV